MKVFELSEIQAEYILELRLRRLTKFSKLELETEKKSLQQEIAQLKKILASEALLREMVSTELAEVAEKYGVTKQAIMEANHKKDDITLRGEVLIIPLKK